MSEWDGTLIGLGRDRARHWVRELLPTGETLSPESWQSRHKVISIVLWAHFPALTAFALVKGYAVTHAVTEGAIIAVLAAIAGQRWLSPRTRSVMATLGLVTSSAILVHLSGGVIEMHFHFFVVVAMVALYQSWVPFLVALAYVVLHHGTVGALDPAAVFNHPAAVRASWKWALVHGGFILAESAACLTAWRLNEVALRGERRARGALEKANHDLSVAQRLSSIGSWDWDLERNTVWWSHEMFRIFGQEPDAYVPSLGAFLDHVHPEDRPRIAVLIERSAGESGGDLDYECRVVRADGQVRIVHALGHRAIGDDGRPRRLLGTMQDITDRKALEEQVEYRAFHDALTGLANRSLFLDRLDHALDVRQRTGMPIALLYLDVDDFKAVNDTLGHTVGDDLLVQVAERIRDAVRAGDTVARLGGDEFAVLLEDTDTEGAARAAETVLQSLLEPLVLHGAHVLVRASIGVVVAQRSMDTEELLRRADIAMYAAKRQGKHAYRVFHETMQSALRTRLGLEAELAEAIEQEQFLLHYQPIVDLTGERLRGVEALIRWDHPRHGVLPPTEFVPLAEETGLITGLGSWVLRTAAKQVAGLQAELGAPISLSINLSPLQLHTDVLAMTRAALTDSGLAPANLIVEITETSMMSQQDAIRAKLVQLRKMGVRVAIDDFGTGYSSLAYLKQLPIDILKIDRAFIRNITGGPEESALAHAIIKLAGLFGLSTVGEGIENAEQAAVLRLLGCGSGQGYYYCRPVEARRLVQEVRSGRLRLPDARAAAPLADKVPPRV